MGRVRIVGGLHRSRVLQFKDNVDGLRPTPDRVRETLFNWLGQDLTGKICLDLFAGSGALGFEALSRNALSAIMVEQDKAVVKDLLNNKKLLKISNLEIICENGLSYLKKQDKHIDILFLDPPYDSDLLNESLQLIYSQKESFKNTLVYIEYRKTPDLTNYSILKQAKAGVVKSALIQLAYN